MILLCLVVALTVNIVTTNGQQNPGSADRKSFSKLLHLKEEFELFRKELDSLLVESSSPVVEESIEHVESTDGDRRCDCDAADPNKRCASGCGKKTPVKTNQQAADDLAKRCAECDSSDSSKRCPAECRSKTRTNTKTEQHASNPVISEQHVAIPLLPESEVMRRFLKALPAEDQRLVENSRAKKEFIERLIRKTNYGSNKKDVEVSHVKKAASETSPVRSSAILDIGVRSMPAEDSSVMLALKRSLSANEQQLLKNHKSKTRFIQGLLEKRTEPDERDRDVEKTNEKRQLDDPVLVKFMEGLDDSEKKLIQEHPSYADNIIEAIKAGHREEEIPPQEKREFSPDEIENVINKLGDKKDQMLVRAHLSKIDKVAVAESRPVGVSAEDGIDAQQLVSRLFDEVEVAKKKGFSLEKLFEAMKKRANEH